MSFMIHLPLCILLVLAALLPAATAVSAAPATSSVPGAAASSSEERRCTDDGRDCITRATYAADVCEMIERNATEQGLDPSFLARLLWKESRFEPSAISPAGAMGIAQFMPSTAELYLLDDPFNPAKAIRKAAWYLAQLNKRFGNIGLAAVAYNGGENRAARFVSQQTTLPFETVDYVEAITGFSAHRWRDNPPRPQELKLALTPGMPFRAACEKLAGDRRLREFATQPPVMPWGVIVASHPDQAGAVRQVARLNRTLRPILDGDARVGYVRKRMNGMTRAVYTAQVGYRSRAEAATFCNRLKRLGGRCIVLKN